ncbi:fungal hydrophobin-domain-containing protein [Cyathus striatus]|nr:fungal hydrophobin-domain-containing protein [Cyathus striatus]
MRFTPAFALALPILAAATAVPRDDSQCNTGSLLCCNSVQDSSSLSPLTNTLLGLLGIVVGPLTALIGSTCSPITVGGVAGNSCTAQPVCCTNNSFNGLIAVGCNPVNLNL